MARKASPQPLLCRSAKTLKACLTFFNHARHGATLDFSKVGFVDPPALVLLHHLAGEQGGIPVHLPNNVTARKYFMDNLTMSASSQGTPKVPNKYPLRYVNSETEMVRELGQWRDMLVESDKVSEETARAYSSTMSEVLVNSFSHGGASKGEVIVAGQTFGKRKHSVLAAVDRGRGIPTSLRASGRYGNERTDEQWILMSLEKGVTSKTRPSNRGFGLHYLKTMVQKNKGSLILLSGGGIVSITDGGEPVASSLSPHHHKFNGTFLIVDIKVS